MSPDFTSTPAPYTRIEQAGNIIFRNKYTSWSCDGASGQLVCAKVHYGSNENLLTMPLFTQLCVDFEGRNSAFKAGDTALELRFGEDFVERLCNFHSEDGRILPGVTLWHRITFGEWGNATNEMKLHIDCPIENVHALRPVIFGISDSMKFLATRHRNINGTGLWTQHLTQWTPLGAGRLFTDSMPYLSNALPLTILFLNPGCEGFQFELGDDLAAWTKRTGYQEAILIYMQKRNAYQMRLATFMDMPGQTLEGEQSFSFRLSLPFIREKLVPLRRASSMIQVEKGFERCMPDDAQLARIGKAGYGLLRLHFDNDKFGNGIFWRDAVYPPFPPEYMDKMDAFIKKAHSHGIKVVPYFSAKEMHPEAEGYAEHCGEWARLPQRDYGIRVSEFGTPMCLASGWSEKRRATIKQVLDGHDFDGVYYDWTTGLECWNTSHAEKEHWDNEQLMQLLKWTAAAFPRQQERYEHFTHVASFAHENTATMIICEERSYAQICFGMFSPHLHFVNIAPRQICDMLSSNCGDEDRRRLAIIALLHHATVSSIRQVYLDFYAELPWLDGVTEFEKHSAPGEGIVSSDNEAIGCSLYWNRGDERMLLVCGNISDCSQNATVSINIQGRVPCTRIISLEPLSISVAKIN